MVVIVATWTAVTKQTGGSLTDGYDLIAKQSKGQFAYESGGVQDTTDWSDAEHLLATQDQGFLAALVTGTDSIWGAVSKVTTSSWTPVTQSGTVAAQFELNEPLGGPEWVAVEKDT